MSIFWATALGGLTSAVAVTIVSLTIMRPAMRRMLSPYMRRLVTDGYQDNLLGVVNALRRVGGQNFVETMMRAATGECIQRPLGSPLPLSPWEQLLLQPVYLTPRLPTPDEIEIDTKTVIGPRAARPLACDIPILIAAMSYGGALSVKAKIALAKGASRAGTATNSGESYLADEREHARRLIVQHHRGLWPNGTMQRPELLERADAIEIHLGQGAQAAAAMRTPARSIDPRMRAVYGLERGQEERIATRFRDVQSADDFVRMVHDLKARADVPVGVKVGVSGYIERDLGVFLEAGVDFVTVDGAEGGTHGGPTTLQDDVGLPTLYGIARADAYLRQVGGRDRLSLIAAGGLTTPGRYIKAMALGADAVYIGTVALVAALTRQMKKTLPWEPPFDLVLQAEERRWHRAFDVDRAALHLANYLASAMADIRYTVQVLGKRGVHEVDRDDLVALSFDLGQAVGVRTAWQAPEGDPDTVDRVPCAPVSGRARPGRT